MSLTQTLSSVDSVLGADSDASGCRSSALDFFLNTRRQSGAARGNTDVTLKLKHAGEQTLRIRWECQGPVDAPVLIVQGGISANRHVSASTQFIEPGWWQEQAGAGAALDTQRFRLLAIDWLAADGSLDVCIDPADQADAICAVLDDLQIKQARAFVGASYGAMVGLQFAARHPTRVQQLIAISGAHRSHAQTTALRVIQRRIVKLGLQHEAAAEALALARALAVIGYRSGEEFEQRFDAEPTLQNGSPRFAVEDYFDAVGSKFVARFSTAAYLRLSESIDLQRVAPESIAVPTVLVAINQDQIVPLADLQALAAGIAAPCQLHRIDSLYGHDAFLKEIDAIQTILTSALNAGSAA
jgi:homoserine O-acetyltransferase/O-succinyltransferase